MSEIRKNKYIRSGKPKEPTVFSPAWHRDEFRTRGDLNFWYSYLGRTERMSDELREKIYNEINYLRYAEMILSKWSGFREEKSAFIKNYYLG